MFGRTTRERARNVFDPVPDPVYIPPPSPRPGPLPPPRCSLLSSAIVPHQPRTRVTVLLNLTQEENPLPIQNDEQARALATVISCLRPDWDAQGFYAVLRAEHAAGNPLLHRPFVDILNAAQVKAVETNPDGTFRAKTPKVVFMDGAHWAAPTATTPATSAYVAPEDRCQIGRAHV